MNFEQTFFIVKPDGLKIPEVYETLFSNDSGLTVVKIESRVASVDILKEHYSHIKDKPFFKDVVRYMTSSPILIGVLEGYDAVNKWRNILGNTNPEKASRETLRGKYGTVAENEIHNVAHGSDSVINAEREIKLWFGGD